MAESIEASYLYGGAPIFSMPRISLWCLLWKVLTVFSLATYALNVLQCFEGIYR